MAERSLKKVNREQRTRNNRKSNIKKVNTFKPLYSINSNIIIGDRDEGYEDIKNSGSEQDKEAKTIRRRTEEG